MARPTRNHEGDVYDPFLGSGTTLIACEQLERLCYGQELNPVYVDIIVKRWVKWMKDNSKEFHVKHNGKVITDAEWLYN